jgi:hypothetical protein
MAPHLLLSRARLNKGTAFSRPLLFWWFYKFIQRQGSSGKRPIRSDLIPLCRGYLV